MILSLFVTCLLLVALFFFRKQYRRRLQLENRQLRSEIENALRRERDRIAAELHDDLGAGLSTIRLLSLLAKEMETKPDQLERLDKIARAASGVMENIADIVWAMNSCHDTLENLAHYLRRSAGEYLETHGIRFSFEMPENLPNNTLDGEQRRALLLAMKECLHNVVKHADASEVHLRITTNGQLEIQVSDNGSGILPERLSDSTALNGNGLTNLRQRMKALGGSAVIRNNRGTTVVLHTGICL